MMIRWNPWNDLNRLEREVQGLFDGRGFAPLPTNGDLRKPVTWTPPVDVFESTDKIVLVADLPGVDEGDVSIDLEANVLTLRGERKPAPQTEGRVRGERAHGSFTRAFTVPTTVDADKIAADLKAGVLTVTLPKKPEVQPRTIKVSVGS